MRMMGRTRECMFVFALMAFLLIALAFANGTRRTRVDNFAEYSDVDVTKVDTSNMSTVAQQSVCLVASTQVDDACDGDANVGHRMYFGDTSMSTSPDGENNSDPYYLQKVGGGDNSSLRLTINDDADESFQIWGNSCTAGDCRGEGMMAHRFMANGDVLHARNLITTGHAGFGGSLNVDANSMCGGTFGASGDGSFGGKLIVSGSGSFGRDVSISEQIEVDQSINVGRDGNFGVVKANGDGVFGGAMTVSGSGVIGGSASVGGPLIAKRSGQFGNEVCVDDVCFSSQELSSMKRNASEIMSLRSELDAMSSRMNTRYENIQQKMNREDANIRQLIRTNYDILNSSIDITDRSLRELVNENYLAIAANDNKMRSAIQSKYDSMMQSVGAEDAKLGERLALRDRAIQDWKSNWERGKAVSATVGVSSVPGTQQLVPLSGSTAAGAGAAASPNGGPAGGSAANVTMFKDCPYQGQSVSKPVGRYNMNEMGIPDNSISSIKVTPGYAVTVFEHPDFKGRSQTFTSDVPCLVNTPGGNWNDIVSSFIVTEANTQNAVTMFKDCPYLGQSVSKPVGRYNMNEMGIPDNSISSIKVTPGYAVTVFEHPDFKGRSQTFTSDVPCLVNTPGGNWNDIVSSFIVTEANTQNVVTMFKDCPYQGQSVSKPVGRYNMNEMGIPDNSISSIKVTPGYAVTVFEHPDFRGRRQTFTSDVPCLVNTPGGNWNDIVSSFIVAKGGVVSGRFVRLSKVNPARVKPNCIYALNIAGVEVFDKNGNDVAFRKPVAMSSVYMGNMFPGANLVDGNRSTFASTHCAYNASNEEKPSMTIDLGRVIEIAGIRVLNRQDCCKDRLQGTTVEIMDNASRPVFVSPPLTAADEQEVNLSS